MKRRKTLPSLLFFKKLRNNRGQAIVEFVLLLVVISGITYGFTRLMTRGVFYYWSYYANLVVDDKPGTTTLRKQ